MVNTLTMSYITPENINSIWLDMTNWCNASCPMCARFDAHGNLLTQFVNSTHTSLETIKNGIGEEILSKIKLFWSCGVYGDALMNPECFEIFEYVRNLNPNCLLELHTNGGIRDEKFWQKLAKINVKVVFGIDGLEDTNHLYRRGVKWNKLINNINCFISHGGWAEWKFLIFKHNQHQVNDAIKLAKKLNFTKFRPLISNRWELYGRKIKINDYLLEPPDINDNKFKDEYNFKKMPFFPFDKPEDFNDKKPFNSITCRAHDYYGRNEVFIKSNGIVYPCCMLDNVEYSDELSNIDNKLMNINYTKLKDILSNNYFKRISDGINDNIKIDPLTRCKDNCTSKNFYYNHSTTIKWINKR